MSSIDQVALLKETIEAQKLAIEKLKYDRQRLFAPTKKQLEFLNATGRRFGYDDAGNEIELLPFREILLTGGRQITGKSYTITGGISWHMNGRYPDYYQGKRFEKPVRMAGGSKTAKLTRDVFVRYLLGPEGDYGSGWIPRDCFADMSKDIVKMTGGLQGQIDKFRCKHFTNGVFDGWSEFIFFSYDSGRENLQGLTLDAVFLDEEPPLEVKQELAARTDFTLGPLLMTFSTMQGYSETIAEFMAADANERGRFWLPVPIESADHLTEEQKAAKIRTHKGTILEDPELNGIPNMGEGLIYKTPDQDIVVDDREIPSHWRRINGTDMPHTAPGAFGFGALAYDDQADTIYLVGEFKAKGASRADCAEAMRAHGASRIPTAWPYDAKRVMDFNVDYFSRVGINMLHEGAAFLLDDGETSNSVFTAIYEIAGRMATGRFKVFKSCQKFLAEKRTYHLDEKGQPAKAQDNHIIDAVHKAVMMLRYARSEEYERPRTPALYGNQEFFQ